MLWGLPLSKELGRWSGHSKKILTDLLVGFGYLLLLHLGVLLQLLENCYRSYFLRSCMMQKYTCLGALQR
jgi:hypothetical protein